MTVYRPRRRQTAPAIPLGRQRDGDTPRQPVRQLAVADKILARLTIEMVIYVGVVAIALFLRANAIGERPFGTGEGSNAYAAFQLSQFLPPSSWSDPAVSSLTALVFFLTGATNVTARLVPLLAGTGLVAAVWLLRPLVGRTPALVTAVLLALSSLFVFSAREASSAALAAVASLVAVSLAFRLLERPSTATSYGLAAALALLLTTGPAGFQTVVIFALFIAFRLAGRRVADPIRDALEQVWLQRTTHARPAIVATALVVLISSGFLLYPAGAGLPAIAGWVHQFDPAGRSVSLLAAIAQALVYDPAIAVLGALGVASIGRRADRTPFEAFIVLWSIGDLLVVVLTGDRTTQQAVTLLLPLVIAAGIFVGNRIDRIEPAAIVDALPATVPLAVLTVFAGIVIALVARPESLGAVGATWLGVFLQPGTATFAPLWVLAFILLGMIAAAVVAATVLLFGSRVGRALVVLGVAILILFTLHSGARLNYANAPELIAPMRLSAQGVSMANRIAELADRLEGRPVQIVIAPGFEEPLRWYLRSVSGVTVSAQPRPDATIQVLAEGAAIQSATGAYLVEKAVWQIAPPDDLSDVAAFFRWWAYGETPQPAVPSAMMYYRYVR